MLNISAKFHENRTFTFQEITTSITNERTNQQTNKPAWSLFILAEVVSIKVCAECRNELEKSRRVEVITRAMTENVRWDWRVTKGAITSKIKQAIKHKTSPARLAQLLQPSLAFCFSLQPMTAYRPGGLIRAATVVQQLCKSCRTCFMFYCMFYFTCDRSLKAALSLVAKRLLPTSD